MVKNILALVVVFGLLYFILQRMAIWVNVRMTGWEFIIFVVVVTGIGVYLTDRFNVRFKS